MIMKKLTQKVKAIAVTAAMTATTLAGALTIAPQQTVEAAGNDNYAKLLQYSLYFFDANMCGDDVGTKGGMQWRDNCHTGDEVPGGFHDAGDHAMFGLPQGYTASTLGWSYYEFKDAYQATGQTEHLKMITDRFCDFFKRSTKLSGDTVTNFLYQKGDGNEDHSYWGKPELQEQEKGRRKMYWTSNGASDIAAEYAAALAVNYLNFGNAEDLKYAEALYKFSTQYNQVAKEGPATFYDNSSCQDEQAWAAGWLYLATKKENYKNDCGSKYNQYLGWVHGWESVDLGAACLYAEITNNWSSVNSYMQGKFSGNGYFFLDKWGSARLNCSAQMTALVASKKGNANMQAWAKGQMDYILGNNPRNTCFVTGFASNSAKNAHHRAASGYQGYNPPDGMNEGTTTYHPTNGKTLIGALVGGPSDQGGSYNDVMNDYVANEVALDYNAGLVGAAAGLYSFYKTGTPDTSITGVKKIYSGGSTPVNPPVTTAPPAVTTTTSSNNPWNPTVTTTTQGGGNTPTPGGNSMTATVNKQLDSNTEGSKSTQIPFSQLFPSGAKPQQFIVKLTGNVNGISVGCSLNGTSEWTDLPSVQPQVNGNTATYTYDVSSVSVAPTGVFQVGYWWGQSPITLESVTCVYSGGSSNPVVTQPPVTQPPVTQPPVTQPPVTQPPVTQPPVQTTASQGGSSSGGGAYEYKPNQSIDYSKLPEDDKMIGWKWSDLGLKAGDKPSKVEINISASKNIGKWEGAFGSSTSVAPSYWTQTSDMSQTFSGNTGTITWDISSADQSIIQVQYGGELKFGIWWIDCQQFNIDSIKVYTGSGSGSTTPTQPTVTTTTTQRPNTPAQTTTTTTKSGGTSSGGNGAYEYKPNQSIDYSKLPEDDKMIGWKWSDLGLKAGDKPSKVEINISASKNIGKWEGAFGSSTSVAPGYWTQTSDMSQTFSGNTGTITWDISSADQSIIQVQYGGELKFGIWWIDCQQFNIDSIKVYTGGSSSTPSQPAVTTTTTTTTRPAPAQTTTTTTTPRPAVTTPSQTNPTPTTPTNVYYGDVNQDNEIGVADIIILAKYMVNKNLFPLKEGQLANADVNHDGIVDTADTSRIIEYVLGKIKSF